MQLVLGTVQFGVAYGIAGRGSRVPEAEVKDILALAWERGIRTLDTAALYGDIEERLRRLAGDHGFAIVSKLAPVPPELDDANAARWAVAAANESRSRLGPRLRALMLHRAEDFLETRGDTLARALLDWGDRHDVAIGASCYLPETFEAVLDRHGIALFQFPGNALDQRLCNAPLLAAPRPSVHVRSAFLQGLLLIPSEAALKAVPNAAKPLQIWREWLNRHGLSPLEGALSVVRGFPHGDACVVGVDSAGQLNAIADVWASVKPLKAPELACDDLEVIDPRRWRRAA